MEDEIQDAIDEYRMMMNYNDKEDLKMIRKEIQYLKKLLIKERGNN